MDDLPELPFEKVLSYLSLDDRLKTRAVAKRWYHKINSFKVKSLCYSSRPSDFISGKSRWVSGAFAQNFISSSRFATFFDTFGQTILSSLKRLRLCDLHLNERDRAAFARTLNSFSQLEELDIIRAKFDPHQEFSLNLPMLTSLHFEGVNGIEKLTLEAPKLREVKIQNCFTNGSFLRAEFVHGELVERLLIEQFQFTEVKKLKNLQFLYIENLPEIDSTFLSSLQQLKEIHMNDSRNVSELFEQKQRSGRADLKIYFYGLLLNGPHDPAINTLQYSSSRYLSREWLVCLTQNRSRLANQIPFHGSFICWTIEGVAPEVDILKRFTDLNKLIVKRPVQDIERFLDLLKNCENIVQLWVVCDQPQDLFDRLPEHSAVQKLTLTCPPPDLAFLFRLKHLIRLCVHWPIDIETVRRAFEELPALSWFIFRYGQKQASIEIVQSKQFWVKVDDDEDKIVSDLNAAMEIVENSN